MEEKREHEHCAELCEFMDEVKDMAESGGQEEEIPKLRTPLRSYAYAVCGILGILAIAAVMLYAWSQVL